ncbi:12543_t:CDS:1 [Gigaspora margarita]|uniref:12543_t:CDS:1 n=1 Tax=Gigaspora margarita TaxID=4874 RepID=A0ABN7ULU5_GIGMA|nr:12543_t:CDS:1 [Gigaspora margarita]
MILKKKNKYLDENFKKLPEEYQQLVKDIGNRHLGPSYDDVQMTSIAVWLKNEEQYTALDHWQGTSNLNSYYKSNVLNELIKKRNKLQTEGPRTPDLAATISTLASAVSTLESTTKTNNFYYVKLVISNFSTGDLYLAKYGGSDLNVLQPVIYKNTSATYMCKSETFRRLSAQLAFWSAKDLYSTTWAKTFFCVSINNDDKSRLLVYECAGNDSLEDVMSKKVGKEVINLTNGATYNKFYSSYVYASVTADIDKKIEINLHLGGNPFQF